MPQLHYLRGRAVHDYVPDVGLQRRGYIYRLRQLWVEHGVGFDEVFAAFAREDKLESLDTLVIGDWGQTPGALAHVAGRLIDIAPRLMALRTLVFGDISPQEQPLSTITHGDMTPLLDALPQLEYLRVRGGRGLRFKELTHRSLRELVIETTGMYPSTLEDIVASSLGELAHLELWLGDEAGGWGGTMDDLQPLLHGYAYPKQAHPFPKLKRLGLRNAAEADAIAHQLRGASALKQLRMLDLSKGALTDAGAHALALNPMLRSLDTLDLRSNFVTDEDLIDRIRAVGVEVRWGNQKPLPGLGGAYYVDASD
ncbi:MAG: hypothetical protein AAGI01_15680 [Myxococcota bacterium]